MPDLPPPKDKPNGRTLPSGKSKNAVKKTVKKVATGGGSPRSRAQHERREALLDDIRKLGHANLNVREFARRWRVSKTIIYRDLAALGEELGDVAVEAAVLEAMENLRRSDEEALLILEEARKEVRKVMRGDELVTLPAVADAARVGAAKLLSENVDRRVGILQKLGKLKGDAAALGSKQNPVHVSSAAEALRAHLQAEYLDAAKADDDEQDEKE